MRGSDLRRAHCAATGHWLGFWRESGEGSHGGHHRRIGRLQVPDHRELGEAPDGWSFKEVGAVGSRQKRQRLRLQSRRAPDDGVRPQWQFPALMGRGAVPAGAWRPYGPGRLDLPDRRRRQFRPQMPARRRQGAAGARRARQAGALHVRASRSIAAPTPRCRRRAKSTSRTATAIRASTNIRPTANC